MAPNHRRTATASFTLLVALAAGCSSSGSGGGASGDGGCPPSVCSGSCPIVLPTSQVPFSSMPCNALTQADFTPYGVTTFTTPMTSFGGTGCNYLMQYKDGAGANVIVNFKPGCQFATDRTTYKSENDGGPSGGPDIANFQDVPNLGDGAFYFEDSAESNVEVLHGSVALVLTSSVCNQMECMGPQAMPTTIALAKLVISRF